MLGFFVVLLFGIMIGMVLNHAIEDAERTRVEHKRLKKVVDEFWGDNDGIN